MSTAETNRPFVAAVNEPTPGTRVALTLPTDNNIEIYCEGQPSVDTPVETIGRLANGKYDEGNGYSRVRKIALPEMMMEFAPSGDKNVAPNWWKIAKACGMVEVQGVDFKSIDWTGDPGCETLSADFALPSCGATPDLWAWKLRGGAGSIAIGADGPNDPITVTISNFMGAFLGKENLGALSRDYGTLDDTKADKMGLYVCTIGAQVYTLNNWKWDLGVTVEHVPANNDEGILLIKKVNFEPRFSGTVVSIDPVTDDIQQDLLDDVETATITISSASPNSNWAITFTGNQPRDVQPSEVGGTGTEELNFYTKRASFAQK